MTHNPTNSYSVLVAEDDPLSFSIIEANLHKLGHKVTGAANGIEALELLKRGGFPILITDLNMPVMDGLELCRAVRAQDLPGYVYIMIVTSLDSRDHVITGLQAGADEYLTKPINHSELEARLNTGKRILELERSLKNANEEIHLLSITDPLTKVFNRGYLSTRLPDEIARAQRYDHPLSIIMSDIDHFKSVNDSLGHLAGDLVLEQFAGLLKGLIRPKIDCLARYGGEEFVIILPETKFSGAKKMADRLHQSVNELTIPLEGEEISVTASFGVSGFEASPPQGVTPDSLIKHVDALLYQAKNEGRNRVIAEVLKGS
jgi:two-component system cell cycle response regulator